MEFSPAANIGYDLTKAVSPGIEYYGGLRADRQLRAGEPAGKDLCGGRPQPRSQGGINLGIGVGLAKATDGLILKSIIGRRF